MASPNSNLDCTHARLYYYDFLDEETETHTPESASKHIAQCKYCQAEVVRLKALLADTDKYIGSEQSREDSAISSLFKLHFAYIGKPVACNIVKPLLPGLADPAQKVRIPTPITAHLDNCQACSDDLLALRSLGLTRKQLSCLGQLLAEIPPKTTVSSSQVQAAIPSAAAMGPARMQQLHETVCNIAERPESGVVTCLTFKEQFGAGVKPESDDLYVDWPVNVQLLEKSEPIRETSPATITFPQRLKQRVTELNLVQFIKPVTVAAAVIIAFALFFSTQTAKAITLSQVYEAVAKVKNVCISRFLPGATSPWQKFWLSRPLNYNILMDKKRAIFVNISDKTRKVKDFSTNEVQISPVSEDMVIKTNRLMNRSFGLLPFDDISVVPEDARWNRAEDKNLETTISNAEVYDLTWSKTEGTITEYYKWRVFIDTKTNLPVRVEWYRKTTHEENYILRSTEVVTYPSDSVIETLIQSEFD